MILISLALVAILGGFMLLQGCTAWYKKDIPRAIIFAAGGFFMVMTTTLFTTVASVERVLNQKLEQQVQYQRPPLEKTEIPPYRGNQ